MHASNGHAEREENFALKPSVKNLQRQIEALSETFENLQLGNSSGFPPSPTEFLEEYESIENPVERQFFWDKHQETIKVGLEARNWEILKKRSLELNPPAKPPPGSLSSQYETLMSVDPVAGRRFFEVHKEEIHAEANQRFLERKSPKSASLETPVHAQTFS